MCDVERVCNSDPCQNGATCNENNNQPGYTCTCAPGFTGTNCQFGMYVWSDDAADDDDDDVCAFDVFILCNHSLHGSAELL